MKINFKKKRYKNPTNKKKLDLCSESPGLSKNLPKFAFFFSTKKKGSKPKKIFYIKPLVSREDKQIQKGIQRSGMIRGGVKGEEDEQKPLQ